MKKVMLICALSLSVASISQSTIFADESKAANKDEQVTTSVINSEPTEHKEENKSEKEASQTTVKPEQAKEEKKDFKKETEKAQPKEKVTEVKKEGWQQENSQWLFYENNQPVINWKKIGGVWYYFNQNGVMLSNTVFNDYIFSKSGALVENSWIKLGDNWFYASEEGKIAKNKWKKISGVWYYFNQDGIMLNNTIYNDYLFNASGALVENGWVKLGDNWFYANQEGKISRDKWEKIKGVWYHFDTDGIMESSIWKNKYYLKNSGAMASAEWIFDQKYNSWFYIKPDGTYAENDWQGAYYLKSGGYMAINEWIYDKNYSAWYYLKENGAYVTGTYNIKGKDYTFQSNGKWISNQSSHYKVKPITAYIYSASGTRLSYINQGSIVTVTGSETQSGRIPVQVSGLSGYMNKSDLTAVSASNEFIPHYTSDGRYVYHELSPYTSIRVAPHHSSMAVGKKYYSADGINFDNFSINNPFQFRDLSKPTNYTAEELDKVYSLMNIKGSRLAGKGAIFKEAERRYQINALYLMAHSALESSWGRSQIAKDKNNFFGIAAYDSTPYHSAKSFDNVDKGILGAAKWIRENYLDEGRTHLGNKSSGMNVLYASDPYWGEKIASIMMTINSRLGDKD